jgi:hypothetical protein
MKYSSGEFERVLKNSALGAAGIFGLVWLGLGVVRLFYPYELEWMEGEMVDHVRWLLAGNLLYAKPSIEFISSIYTPLYTYVSAGVTLLTGEGFFPLRLVSFLATLGCLGLIFRIVQRETGHWTYGLLAMGVFAGTYRASGAWFELARVDMLALLLLLGAVYLLRFRETLLGWGFAGLLLALAVMTKQSLLCASALLLLYGLVRERKLFLSAAGTFIIILISSVLFLNELHDGWFWFYTVQVPSQQQIFWSYPVTFLRHDLMRVLPMGIIGGLFLLLRPQTANKDRWFFGLLTVGLLIASLLPSMKIGGYDNCCIPAYAALAICFGVGLRMILESISPSVNYLRNFVWLLCLLQFAILIYRADRDLPTQADYAANQQLIAKMRAVDGPVFMISHGFLPALAGKKTFTHHAPFVDIVWGADPRIVQELKAELDSLIQSETIAAYIIDQPLSNLADVLEHKIFARYGPGEALFEEELLWSKTGTRTRPARIVYSRPQK